MGDVRACRGSRVDRRKGDERGGLNRRLRGTRSYLLVSQAKLPPPRRFASLSLSLSLATPRYSITNSTEPVLARYSGPPDRPLSAADHRWHIGKRKRASERTKGSRSTRRSSRSRGYARDEFGTCTRTITCNFLPEIIFARKSSAPIDLPTLAFLHSLPPPPPLPPTGRILVWIRLRIGACVRTRVLIDRDRED